MKEQERINQPYMSHYRTVYKDSKRWDNDKLENKRIIVYMEQGYGDQLMMLRFIRFFKHSQVIICASKPLHRVIQTLGVEVIDKESKSLPDHDFHILSLSLPFILKVPLPLEPYIHIPEKTELIPGFNIGIAWEGSKDNENNDKRSCPLKYFKVLKKENVNLFSLLPNINDYNLLEDCEDFDLNGVELNDFYDTGKLINSLDLIVTVDTAVLHLAGAIGKTGYGLLNTEVRDPRWNFIWYPSVMLLKSNNWGEMFSKIKKPLL